MALVFGILPERGDMALSRYGDFVTNGRLKDGSPIPDGASLEFRFFPPGSATVVWAASISDDRSVASWSVDKAQVAALVDAGAREWRLFYLEGSLDAHIGTGPIRDVS